MLIPSLGGDGTLDNRGLLQKPKRGPRHGLHPRRRSARTPTWWPGADRNPPRDNNRLLRRPVAVTVDTAVGPLPSNLKRRGVGQFRTRNARSAATLALGSRVSGLRYLRRTDRPVSRTPKESRCGLPLWPRISRQVPIGRLAPAPPRDSCLQNCSCHGC